MACSERWYGIVSAWHDGEATAAELAGAREHLARCRSCAATLEELRRLTAELRALREPDASPRLRRRAQALAPRRAGRRVAAGALALGTAAALILLAWPSSHLGTALADELEGHHLKAFSRASPCEFESADPAAVRAWLSANVGYAVDVPSVPGATLLGARRCKLGGVLTASVLYRRGGEALTLFLPRAGTRAEAETARFAGPGARCTMARLGEHICARPGRFAVAGSDTTALAALEPI